MSYTKNVWRDLETGGTPITAEKLNHIEDGIEDLDQFRDSISQEDVLWSKPQGWYMSENQEADLSKPVSECATGVMLHWQGYEPGGSVGNYDHYYQYVPKHHVAKIDGAGIAFVMGSQAKIARKYLYVHDDYIQGHELNDQEVNMTDGGKFYNNRFVLTEIFEC